MNFEGLVQGPENRARLRLFLVKSCAVEMMTPDLAEELGIPVAPLDQIQLARNVKITLFDADGKAVEVNIPSDDIPGKSEFELGLPLVFRWRTDIKLDTCVACGLEYPGLPLCSMCSEHRVSLDDRARYCSLECNKYAESARQPAHALDGEPPPIPQRPPRWQGVAVNARGASSRLI
ncbi:hypothetical protein CTAYLR_005083, partial [Chrysophaeum taylorii]